MAKFYKVIKNDVDDRIKELHKQIKEAEIKRIENGNTIRDTEIVPYLYKELYLLQEVSTKLDVDIHK
mgnify:CR=1 FL=1